MNELSGELTVVGNLDREDEDEYELTITASDGGKDRWIRERCAFIIDSVLGPTPCIEWKGYGIAWI